MIGAAFVASLAASAVLAAPVPAPATPASDAVHNATAYYYYQNGRAGACGKYSADSDLVVGLPAEQYPAPFDTVSPYCGKYVLVSGINKNITARVADASTLNNTMTFSIGAWDALNATETDLTTVSWRFANETEAAAAAKAAEAQPTTPVAAPSSTRSVTPKKPSSSATEAAASTTPAWVASSSSAPASSSSSVAYATTTTAAWESSASSSASSSWTSSAPAESSSSWTPSESTASAPASSASASSTWQEEASSTSSWTAPSSSSTSSWTAPSSSSTSSWTAPSSTTTTSEWVAPTTTTTTSEWVAPTTTTTTSEWVAPTTTQAAATQAVSNANSNSYSGQATFYSQGGVAGSCGTVNPDSAYIIALPYALVDGGAHCGQSVWIKNSATGATIQATVADTCPGCGPTSIDLSTAAFGAIGNYDQGVLPITWGFN